MEDKEKLDKAYMQHVRDTAALVGDDLFYDIDHQVSKYGAQRIDGFGWIAVISEEWGETVQAFLKQDFDEAIAEAKQTIACLSRFITEVEREQEGIAAAEREHYVRAE